MKTVRPKRGAAVANFGVAVIILVVVASVALFASPPSPPSIAEFAPQAQQQIEEAPAEQSAEQGTVAGGGTQETIVIEEEASAAPTPAAAATDPDEVIISVPSAVNCVTWPDGSVTQTFDPQSPPCVPTWKAADGNGGATATGVTETEIVVGVPESQRIGFREHWNAAIRHFNASYEFYGRKLRLVTVPLPGDPTGQGAGAQPEDPSVQAATGAALVENNIFAAFGYPAQIDASTYRRTLVNAGVISLTSYDRAMSEQELASPLVWTFQPTEPTVQRHAAEFICTSLAGRPARTGGSDLGPDERSFAILTGETFPDHSVLQDALAACGIQVQLKRFPPDARCENDPGPWRAMVVDLKSFGVTTNIVLEAGGNDLQCSMQASNSVDYFPEWFLPQAATGDMYIREVGAQAKNLFGLQPKNGALPLSEEMWTRATASQSNEYMFQLRDLAYDAYVQLLLLASGIQGAGPNLTPETFEAALLAARFPNPGAASAPFFQASGSYLGDSTFIDDVGLWWWDQARQDRREDSQSRANDAGRCPYEGGSRFRLGAWPEGIELFTPCTT